MMTVNVPFASLALAQGIRLARPNAMSEWPDSLATYSLAAVATVSAVERPA